MDLFFKNTEIIVINQNGKSLLHECFQSIHDTVPTEVTITLLDNASTDGSIEFVRQEFPRVQILNLDSNHGFAGGYDLAIKKSSAQFIVMLNNDIKVLPNWFEPLLAPLQDPKIGITGSRLYHYSNPEILDHAGGKISVSGGGVDIGKKNKDTFSTENYPCAYACGAAMAFRKSTYLELGGFDPDYIIYHEDVDLGWKANLAGLQVIHVPSSKILHKVSASMGNFENPRRLYLSQKNRLLNLYKNAGFFLLLKGLASNFIFDCVRIPMWILTGNFKNILALIRANIDVTMTLPKKLSLRRNVQKKIRNVSDRTLRKNNLIAGFFESLTAYRQLKK